MVQLKQSTSGVEYSRGGLAEDTRRFGTGSVCSVLSRSHSPCDMRRRVTWRESVGCAWARWAGRGVNECMDYGVVRVPGRQPGCLEGVSALCGALSLKSAVCVCASVGSGAMSYVASVGLGGYRVGSLLRGNSVAVQRAGVDVVEHNVRHTRTEWEWRRGLATALVCLTIREDRTKRPLQATTGVRKGSAQRFLAA